MKTDGKLGQEVHAQLKLLGVETPALWGEYRCGKQMTEEAVESILKNFNLNLEDDSLKGTPLRVSRMYHDELFRGMDYDNFPKCTVVTNKFNYDEMVTIKKIPIKSLCEHHLMPIDGYATISYIPNCAVLGLSKFNRVADFFARRPQVQERLTEQIYHALVFILGTNNIAVKIDANHYCMKFRGVKSENSITTTTKLGGTFMDVAVRAEFLNQKE